MKLACVEGESLNATRLATKLSDLPGFSEEPRRRQPQIETDDKRRDEGLIFAGVFLHQQLEGRCETGRLSDGRGGNRSGQMSIRRRKPLMGLVHKLLTKTLLQNGIIPGRG